MGLKAEDRLGVFAQSVRTQRIGKLCKAEGVVDVFLGTA